MDGNQSYCLAIAPLQQAQRHLHECVRSCAPLILDVSHSHCLVAHQAYHPGPQMRQEVSHGVDDGLHLQKRWCATIFEMLTTVPVSSVSLTGLPSPNWPHPWRVTSVSLVARGRSCRTAGDAHQATSARTHWGTVILSDQFPFLCHQAVAAHYWTGRRRSLPRRTSEAINTTMPSNLWRSRAVMTGLVIQCWWTDWTLRRIFGRGATVNCRVLNCIPMNWKSWLGVRSDFS